MKPAHFRILYVTLVTVLFFIIQLILIETGSIWTIAIIDTILMAIASDTIVKFYNKNKKNK